MRNRSHALLVAALAALAAVATWVTWRQRSGAMPVPGQASGSEPPRASEPADAIAGPRAVTRSAPPPSAERVAAGPTPGAIRGTVRLRSGRPLTAWKVVLHRPGDSVGSVPAPDATSESWHRLRHGSGTRFEPPPVFATTTDAEGAFAFADIVAGEWEVVLDQVDLREVVKLAPGEGRTVDLVVAGIEVLGSVHRAGISCPRARVAIVGDDEHHPACNEHGGFRCILPPGRYEVRIANAHLPAAPTAVHTVVVPADAPTVAWSLDAGGTDLVVDARSAAGAPHAAFEVLLDGTLVDGKRVVREFHGERGTATFEQIPAGSWQVSVRSPTLCVSSPREWHSSNAIPRDRLTFVVEPAAIVRLVLRRPDGEPMRVEPERLPWLRAGGESLPCRPLERPERGEVPTRIGWERVPAGAASFTLGDLRHDGHVEFLPFDDVPTVRFDVVLGGKNEVVVDVVPRAGVDLRACERYGREDRDARIAVFAGDVPVRGRPDEPQRWLGCLPPGDYRVVVTRRTGEREHTLHVARAAVTERYRP